MTAGPSSTTDRLLLPGELRDRGGGGRVRRSARDWAVDVVLFGLAVFCWMALYDQAADKTYLPHWLNALDAPLGALACASLWLRRRWPVGVALAALPAAVLTDTAVGALMIIVFNLSLRAPARTSVPVLALHLAASLPYVFFYGVRDEDRWFVTLFVLACYLVFFAWGSAARARRQLVLRLRQDAVRAREDHARRLTDARRAERRAIAREMHDVLAHRVSLLSVHAGALAYRTQRTAAGAGPPLDQEEIAESAGVIRDNAHQALEELREVLHVLRADDAEEQADGAIPGAAPGTGAGQGPRVERPQPGLAAIATLVAEARAAGQPVRHEADLPDPGTEAAGSPPKPQLQRTAYRVVQEGLTNARKHAPGAQVTVALAGKPGAELTVRVANPLPAGTAASEIPGAGAGLAGLAERLEIEGGTLRHGTADGVFTLVARLPWPA